MHSYEDRIRAVELYFRYGRRLTVVVSELGYPSVKQLSRWVRVYVDAGDLPKELKSRERYSRALISSPGKILSTSNLLPSLVIDS